MTLDEVTPESFGDRVLGPIVAEFCLQLWSLGSQIEQPEDVALLFCARGGLRLQLAMERFLSATRLPFPLRPTPLMVSRVVAIRPALMRTVNTGSSELLPWAATTLSYEFSGSTLASTARALSGAPPSSLDPQWNRPLTPRGFAELLRHPEGAPVVEALDRQSRLFTRHLHEVLKGRSRAVLVDTGLYGTTQQLLSEGVSDICFSSVLLARAYRPGPARDGGATVGLTAQADGYSPLRRRTAVLRYWHFIEWLFEPDLPSVREFVEHGSAVRSNLEIDGWPDRVQPSAGSAYAGVIGYLDRLGAAPAQQVLVDAHRAWSEFRRTVIRPTREQGYALTVGTRSHDFGKDETWTARSWRGPVAALRGRAMWREGEIARADTALRWPLLAVIEAGYRARYVKRSLLRAVRSR